MGFQSGNHGDEQSFYCALCQEHVTESHEVHDEEVKHDRMSPLAEALTQDLPAPVDKAKKAREAITYLRGYLANITANPLVPEALNAIGDRLQSADALEYLAFRQQNQIESLAEAVKFLLQFSCVRQDDPDPALRKCWNALERAGKK